MFKFMTLRVLRNGLLFQHRQLLKETMEESISKNVTIRFEEIIGINQK